MKKFYISLSSILILTLCIFLNAHANLIVNGDFNSGLDNWDSSGNVQVVHAGPFATIQGMDGNYALLGFGTTCASSDLLQEFDVEGLEQLTISFNWAFDYVDWSSRYNDDAFLSFYMQDGLSNIITLQEIVTNGTLLNPTSGLMYGFFTKTIDISSFSGDDGALRFALIENLGWTESLAGIDNVSVVSAAPVPEPSTLLLAGIGLLGLAGFRRKSNKPE